MLQKVYFDIIFCVIELFWWKRWKTETVKAIADVSKNNTFLDTTFVNRKNLNLFDYSADPVVHLLLLPM